MNGFIYRTLTVVFALLLVASAHGVELASAATAPARSDCHDCGCASECACRGPAKGCNCGSEGLTVKNACGCGCSDGMHMVGGPSWKSLVARSCGMGAPNVIWTATEALGDGQAWRLAHEHEHPPRLLS